MINDFINLAIVIWLSGVAIVVILLIFDVGPKYKSRLHTWVFWFACIMTALLSWWSVIDYIREKIHKHEDD